MSVCARPRSIVALPVSGLRVDIYRPAHGDDATNAGASSGHDEMTLWPEDAVGRTEDDVLILIKHHYGLRAVPYRLWKAKRWVMFGGNFCYNSDSRFPSDQPIKVFDRVE